MISTCGVPPQHPYTNQPQRVKGSLRFGFVDKVFLQSGFWQCTGSVCGCRSETQDSKSLLQVTNHESLASHRSLIDDPRCKSQSTCFPMLSGAYVVLRRRSIPTCDRTLYHFATIPGCPMVSQRFAILGRFV